MTPPAAFVAPAVEIARSVVETHREAHAETGGPFPFGCCIEASFALRDELRERVPEAGAVYRWGHFGVPGLPYSRRAHCPSSRARCGHAWVDLCDGTKLDPTGGQYSGWLLERFGVEWCTVRMTPWPLVVLVPGVRGHDIYSGVDLL